MPLIVIVIHRNGAIVAIIIRPEVPEDHQKIRTINLSAFETDVEANLIEALRRSGIPLISLVAEQNGELVGHILFSPVRMEGSGSDVSIAGLAPMAIFPEYQKQGIGTLMIEEGVKRCHEAGYAAIVVLGHPQYYQKFGFIPSVRFGIRSEYDVPDDVFMVRELDRGALDGCKGTVKYHEVFNKL